jgi:excisionase family DNA binding protein
MQDQVAEHRPIVMTVNEAARAARLSRSFLYLKIRSGDLPTLKVGRARRVRVSDLSAWLDGMKEVA